MAGDRSLQPLFNKNDRKILFYGGITGVTIICILSLFAFSYTSEIGPGNLIHTGDINFTFAGTPIQTNIYSNDFHTGLHGINGTETNLSLWDGATLTFYPVGDISGYDPEPGKQGNHNQIVVSNQTVVRPGEVAYVYIQVLKNDKDRANMRFSYKDRSGTSANRGNEFNNITWINRKSDNEYVINSEYLPGADISFEVIRNKFPNIFEPYWSFPIHVDVFRCGRDGQPTGADRLRWYDFTGTISMTTDGHFSLRSPISAFSNIYMDKVELKNAKGDLDIKHNGHQCSSADTIIANGKRDVPGNIIRTRLLCGQIITYGNAETLKFREKAFDKPLEVIVKEGNVPILMGLLSSFLTIVLARLIKVIKNK